MNLHPPATGVGTDAGLWPLPLSAGGKYVLVGGSSAAPAGGGKTSLLTVTDMAAVAITVKGTPCGIITVLEDSDNPVSDFYVMRPTSGDSQNLYTAGRSYSFTAPFGTQWQTGQTVGYIELVSVASATFIQDENA